MTGREKQQNRAGFVGMFAILFVIVVAGAMTLTLGVRPKAHYAACQGNLKGMGMAILVYYDQTDRMPVYKNFPAADADVSGAPDETNTTDYKLGDTDAPPDELDWTILGDQAMQNVWLLVMAKLVDEGIFVCPADRLSEPRGAEAGKYGWTSEFQYSYGMQWPYASDEEDVVRNEAPLGTPNTGMMADMAPAGLPYGEGNSIDGDTYLPSNHPRIGTNVLLASGAVKAHEATDNAEAGSAGDDIYLAGPNDSGQAGRMPGSVDAANDALYEADEDTSIALSGR